MQAYLIDPQTWTITPVVIPNRPDRLKAIRQHLACDLITGISMASGDCVYVDDEGLLHGAVVDFFTLRGYPQPLAGRGLVVGTTPDGDDASPRISLADLTSAVCFIKRVTDIHCLVRAADTPGTGRIASFRSLLGCLEREALSG